MHGANTVKKNMYYVIVITSKAWYYVHAFRRNETARRVVKAVQTGIEGTLYQFLAFGFENLDSSVRHVTSKKRGTAFIHNVYNLVHN
jgi:hypothetical protein